MDRLAPYLDWLVEHRFAAVFVASLIDATGLPFPGRIVLLVLGTLVNATGEFFLLVLASTVGSVLGDHVLYGAGRTGGARLLMWYCRVSLGSARCVESTLSYFKRFGPAAVLLARFSFGVRLFAAVLAGAGHIRYWAFIAYDVIGTALYVSLWLGVGHLFGAAFIERSGLARLLLILGPLAILGVIAFRLVRRRRYGAASDERLNRRS